MNIKLKHPSGGRRIEVTADMAGMYESQGWLKVPDPPKKPTTTAATADKK